VVPRGSLKDLIPLGNPPSILSSIGETYAVRRREGIFLQVKRKIPNPVFSKLIQKLKRNS
jgi:hypothetical protein